MIVSVFVSKPDGMLGAIHSQFYPAMPNVVCTETNQIEQSCWLIPNVLFLTNFQAFNTQLWLEFTVFLRYSCSCCRSWIVIGHITLSSPILRYLIMSLPTNSADGSVSNLFSYVLDADGKKKINLPCRTEWQILRAFCYTYEPIAIIFFWMNWSLSAKSIWTNMTRSFSWFLFALQYTIVFIVTITPF